MRIHLLLSSLLISLSFFSQEKRNPDYSGNIGNYPIDLYIDSIEFVSGKVLASYRYQNKKSSLNLVGEITNQIIYFEKTFKGVITCNLYLTIEKDSMYGRWIGNNKSLSIVLYRNNSGKLLQKKCPQDFSKELTSQISGKYKVEYHFINDLFVNEEQLIPEIGFNGGSVDIQELGSDSIYFNAELICGPTYHFAIAEGVAIKQDSVYNYKLEENCIITLRFESKKLFIKASQSAFECGFGARAYLDHELFKVAEKTSLEQR